MCPVSAPGVLWGDTELLVVLPLVRALPATFALAPLAVVTQTLIEPLGMVLFVRLVPRLVKSPKRDK